MTTARNKRIKAKLRMLFHPEADAASADNVYLSWGAWHHFEQHGMVQQAKQVRELLEDVGVPSFGMDPMDFWILAEEYDEDS